MSHTPPFFKVPYWPEGLSKELFTADILNLVAHIGEQVGRLGAGTFDAPFIQSMFLAIAQTLEAQANVPVNVPVNVPANIAELKTPEAIVLLIRHNPHITRQQMSSVLGKSTRTIGRVLAQLQQAEQLQRVGSDKTGHWQVPSR